MRRRRRSKSFPISTLSDRYVNREYSWLQFNRRVLMEAARADNPLLERIKFLAIFESNLDEFYMVRVSGLIEQEEGGLGELSPDGLGATEQLEVIEKSARELRQEADQLWLTSLEPELEAAGIRFVEFADLTEGQKKEVMGFFETEVFPVCTPLILHPNPGVPFISNRSLNIGVELFDEESGMKLGRVKVPTVLPRAIEVEKNTFLLLEDLIQSQIHALFPGVKVMGSWRFRVLRDADIEIRELEASDLISSIEKTLRLRRFGDPVLLETEASMPEPVRRLLMDMLELEPEDVFTVEGLISLDVLWQLAGLNLPRHKFPSHTPTLIEPVNTWKGIFDTVRKQDVLLHHPFDSFRTVDEFVASAAQDPDVLGIKMTLYRVGAQSPIVESLLAAAERGKQVAVMVELKARFDENNNLVWARALERAGVHVSYGFAEQKVHCKLCLVVRREGKNVRTYALVSTGNFNPSSARMYTDLSLLTCDKAITQDVSELFNYLTGFSKQTKYRKLLVSPYNVRDGLIERIEREIGHHKEHGNGQIVFKLNALVDPEVIEALYEASNVGVKVDLNVRGISCIRPGVAGMSENIRVTSVVGRFLEHSRVYYFGNNGHPEVYIGSADLMRRNLDRRTEVLVPVQSPSLIQMVKEEILDSYLRDTTNSWAEQSDGTYVRVATVTEDPAFSAQHYLIQRPFTKLQFGRSQGPREGVSRLEKRKSSSSR